ncbi:MAG: TonB-dependent receptor, partial [Desulfobacterales bacterium]|nr:TonB-dependent receptor [Desulfobacterales bacterium]
MKPWGILILFVALGGLAGNGSAAENKRENPAPFTMETVVVTATRQAQKASSVPAHVTVITESDIKDATAGNIPDLLRTQAGLHITDITGNRRNFMVDVRGFGETAALNTLVLVDGRRINQADLSGTDWTLIPLDRVRRIEIIRGSRGAVLYGDNASGGVINIITKHGETFQTGAALQAGSYNTLKSSAYVSGSQDRLSFALSGSYLNSDGYRDNSGTEASDAGATLSYIVGDRLNLNFSTGYHQDDTSLPGAIKRSDFAAGISRTDSLSPKDFADVKDHYFKGGFEIFFLTDSMLKMDLSFRNRTAFAFSTFSGGNFKGDTEIDTLSASPQLILNEKVFGFKNHLTLGFDVADTTEDIINRSLYFGSSTVGSFKLEKKTDGYYLHDEMNLTDTLAISGGYRHDQARFRFRPSAPDSVTMEQDLFTAGINYNYYKNSHVYVSFSKSFRYPVLD